MMQKRMVEIFTLVFYWVIIAPLIYVIAKEEKWVSWNEQDMFGSVKQLCGLVLVLAAGYLVVYLIILVIYLRLKTWSMQIWVKNNPATLQMINAERAQAEQNRRIEYDPRLIYEAQQTAQHSCILNMETDEADYQPIRHAPPLPRPQAVGVHQKQTKKNKRRQQQENPPTYEEISYIHRP